MNIYEKLQEARIKLQSKNLKKSGKNKFAGFEYYELTDILPSINEIMKELKMCSFIKFLDNAAELIIINSEKPDEQIQFTSPVADAQLKGCTPIQNLGAVQTYLRRYLYVNAFEIVEHDALDAVTGDDSSKTQNNTNSEVSNQGNINPLAKEKVQALRELAGKKGITEKYICTQKKINSLDELTLDQWNNAMKWLQGKEDKK